MRHRLLLLAALVFALAARAHAVCNVAAPTCSAAPFVNPGSGCCVGLTCTIDVDVNLPAQQTVCEFDFGNRDVVFAGRINLGSKMLTVRAATVRIQNQVAGRGTGAALGGTFIVRTIGGGGQTAFAMDANAAQIDLSGPGGGGAFDLLADGAVALDKGRIEANALTATTVGGDIRVVTTNGNISSQVLLQADNGSAGPVRVDGVTLEASGNVVLTNDSGDLSAKGGAIGIDAGGTIDIGAASRVEADELAIVGGTSPQGMAAPLHSLTFRGQLVARNGDIEIEARSGPMVFNRPGSEGLTGSDGSNDTDSTSIVLQGFEDEPTGTIIVDTAVSARGGALEATAGGNVETRQRIDLTGVPGENELDPDGVTLTSIMGDVLVSDRILVNDGDAPGSISLEAFEHDVQVSANLEANASADGDGGSISALAGHELRIAGTASLEVMGANEGGGGTVDLAAAGALTIARQARIVADGARNARGGNVDLAAGVDRTTGSMISERAGDLTIDGTVQAKGDSDSASPLQAAMIELEGCRVEITSDGTVDSAGDLASTNQIEARTALIVAGRLLTGSANIALRTAAPTQTGTVTPAFGACPCPGGGSSVACCTREVCDGALGNPAGCLVPCPTCGNGGAPEWPEECDPGAGTRCATSCDALCRADLPSCDDQRECTDDFCNDVGGCYQRARVNGTVCTDGDACPPDDNCQFGHCVGPPPVCTDGNPCNGVETCDTGTGCVGGTPPTCNDSNPCTNDSCNNPAGCQSVNNMNPCDDDVFCTDGDTCGSGVCQPGAPRACPGDFLCDEAQEMCVAPPPCDEDSDCNTDGTVCNGVETCNIAMAECQAGTPLTCDDGNACTGAETCNAVSGCTNPPDLVCDDGNACNGMETCDTVNGCEPGTPPDCTDSDPCTTNACDPDDGCVITPIPAPTCCHDATDCNDSDVCTDDTCANNACVNQNSPDCCQAAADCNDDNACTTDGPCTDNRCERTPLDGPQPGCGDMCTPGACETGTCVMGDPEVCDDGDPCTDDTCDPETGCTAPFMPECCRNGGECNDDNACTLDTCDLEFHRCTNVVESETCMPCADHIDCDPRGRCLSDLACTGGQCTAVPHCDDGNACNGVETCDAVAGCGAGAAPTCDDGNVCNGVETCDPVAGCQDATDLSCTDDGNACTVERCDPVQGCTTDARTGVDAVTCALDNVDRLLRDAPADAMKAKLRRKIEKKLRAIRAALSRAQASTKPKVQMRLEKKASRLIRSLRTTITRGRGRLIDEALADALASAIGGAQTAIDSLI